MKFIKNHVNLLILLAAAVLVGIDQWVKYMAIEQLKPVHTIPIIQDVFHFTYIENKGAAFGIFEGQRWVLIGVTRAVILLFIVLLILNKFPTLFSMASIGLIIAGGVGNVIDRIVRGFVVDYIHVKIVNFAVFNLADCFVVVGTIMFVIYFAFLEGRGGKKKQAEEQSLPAESVTEPDHDEDTGHEVPLGDFEVSEDA